MEQPKPVEPVSLRQFEEALSSVLGGEPVFTLRGQDVLSAAFVTAWAMQAAALGVPAEKVSRAFATAKAMTQWPVKKMPD